MNPLKQDLTLRFIRAFLPAVIHVHQYTTAHPVTISSIGTAFDCLEEAIGQDEGLSLLFVDDRIVVDREPLEDSLYSGRFIQLFGNKGIQHLNFLRGISQTEMISFIDVFTVNPSALNDPGLFPHIRFGRVGLGYHFDAEDSGRDGDKSAAESNEDNSGENSDRQATILVSQQFKSILRQEMEVKIGVYDSYRSNSSLPDREIRMVVNDIIEAIRRGSTVLLNFSVLHVLDEYNFTHSTNVCILAIAQAMALKIKDEMLHDIGMAALLHDIGKISVPDEVLKKPGSLTEKEWELIRKHPQKGAEYLLNKPGIPPLAAVVAYEHHMLHNYSGYPKVPSYWQQHICSKMTTIADMYDALRTKRVYRDSVETTVICEQLNRMSGNILEPSLTHNFLIMVKKLVGELAAVGQKDC